jgi:hypothetical protein
MSDHRTQTDNPQKPNLCGCFDQSVHCHKNAGDMLAPGVVCAWEFARDHREEPNLETQTQPISEPSEMAVLEAARRVVFAFRGGDLGRFRYKGRWPDFLPQRESLDALDAAPPEAERVTTTTSGSAAAEIAPSDLPGGSR